ncbi:HemY protein [Weissella oryzae SG25]|uniref:HemY protein n=1 Tax=Weissella oryzae (strain DSM 25784 / JCM 18191 / LMG 30913 / SG25) TaxID=1329250 RepID=A0A069CU81_WEIOS|nr:HemY protein [Weissella oryzae SG25]
MSKWSIFGYFFIMLSNIAGVLSILSSGDAYSINYSFIMAITMVIMLFLALLLFLKSSNASYIEIEH